MSGTGVRVYAIVVGLTAALLAPALAQSPSPVPIAPGVRAPLDPTAVRPQYVAAVLDSVVIHDDKDPHDDGEIVMLVGGGTGQRGSPPTVHTSRFPVSLWHEAHSGHTLYPRIPMFVWPEREMREDMLLVAHVYDDDGGPRWLEPAMAAAGRIFGAWLSQELGLPLTPPIEDLSRALARELTRAQPIGGFLDKFSRPNRWGLPVSAAGDIPDPCSHRGIRAGGMTPRYRICRVPEFDPRVAVQVRLDKIQIHDGGDGDDGDLFAWARVFDGVTPPDRRLGEVTRLPASGLYENVRNGSWLAGTERMDKTLYSRRNSRVPVLHVEVGVWDYDTPDAGDDHDMLGVATWLFFLPDLPRLPVRSGERVELPYSMEVRGVDEGRVTVYITLILQRE